MQDFFDQYLDYTRGGEVPICFHRWSAVVGIGAILERNVSLQFGHGHIYPNIYSMLMGEPGTKKSTAIKLIKKLLSKAGYETFAAERTSKEKWLADLSDQTDPEGDDTVLEKNIFGSVNESLVTPNFVAADEANTFFGFNNIEFLNLLGDLWDYEGKFENKVKTGKSDYIPNPTISILSGNTATNFSLAFPPSIFGQGFFSRLLLVYSEPTGTRVTIPRTPSPSETSELVQLLQAIRVQSVGMLDYSPIAYALIDHIYQNSKPVEDVRFVGYANRRLTHLLKLCLIVSCSRLEKQISETTVLQANTYLRYIERLMPKALGEFGKAKNSDISHKVLSIIETRFPVSMKDIFREVSGELEKPEDIGVILRKLITAEKIQASGHLFLPKKKIGSYEDEVLEEMDEKLGKTVDYQRFMSEQELNVKR